MTKENTPNIQSVFKTNRQNELIDLFGHVFMLPTYIICLVQLMEFVFKTNSILKYIALSLAIIPIVYYLFTSSKWNFDIKQKKRNRFFSILFLIILYPMKPYETVFIFTLVELILIEIFLIKRYYAKKDDNTLKVFLLGIINFIILLLLFFWIYLEIAVNSIFHINIVVTRFFVVDVILLLLFFFIRFVFDAFDFNKSLNTSGKSKNVFLLIADNSTRILLFLFHLLLICGTCYIIYFFRLPFIGCLSFIILEIYISGIKQFSSQVFAGYRNFAARLHRNYIYQLISPSNFSQINLVSVSKKILSFFNNQNPTISVFLIWLICGILLPILFYINDIEKSISTLVSIALISSFVLTIVVLFLYFLFSQPKHVVLPFIIMGIEEKKDMDAAKVATLAAQTFVDHLKELHVLLNMRQVENLSLRFENGLPVFVTSGQDKEVLEQFQAIGGVEASNVKLNIGNLLAPFITLLAKTKVRGVVQRQNDNTVTIWIEYIERGGRSVAVDMVLLTEDTVKDINKEIISKYTYQLAIKLIYKLGYHSYLAYSCESLEHFLEGLNAAHHRKWWNAISHYQQAIEIEYANGATFSYGYYHLGAMLLFQGEIEQGLKFLRIAEINGPPLAETNYMLALGQFYKYRDDLHIDRVVFDDIKFKCKEAINQRSDFPEVYHLLGTIYYQRGRLRERVKTQNHKIDEFDNCDPIAELFYVDYSLAEYYFRRAVRKYDKAIKRLPKDMIAKETVFDEKNRIVKDRMAATHRLADALRSSQKYLEAKSYYDEVLFAFPRNNRTMIDIVKTFCFSENWEQADTYLRMDILCHSDLADNKSVNFYFGWACLGGIAESYSLKKHYLNFLIQNYSKFINTSKKEEKSFDYYEISKAINSLEYSYHQYPNYIHRWSQMDWIPKFKLAMQIIEDKVKADGKKGSKKNENVENQPEPNKSKVDEAVENEVKESDAGKNDSEENDNIDVVYGQNLSDIKNRVDFLKYWISWRIDNKNISNNDAMKAINLDIIGREIAENEAPMNTISLEYYKYKKSIKEYVKIIKRSGNAYRIDSDDKRNDIKELSFIVYANWQNVNKKLSEKMCEDGSNIIRNEDRITFEIRWAVDFYLEISLFLCKLFVEVAAFENAEMIADKSLQLILTEKELIQTDPDKEEYRSKNIKISQDFIALGSRVFSFQIASIYAWKAYAILKQHEDRTAIIRSLQYNRNFAKDMEIAKQCLLKSKSEVSHHRLAIFSQALFYYLNNSSEEAVTEFKLLTTVISPLDPHKYISEEYLSFGKEQSIVSEEQPDEYYSDQLSILEHVNGRRQFSSVVNLEEVYRYLAKLFSKKGEHDLAAGYLSTAIANSVTRENREKLFMQLTNSLIKQGAYREAKTTLHEASKRTNGYSCSELEILCDAEVKEVLLLFNLGNTNLSFERTKALLNDVNLSDLGTIICQVINEGDTSDNTALAEEYKEVLAIWEEISIDKLEEQKVYFSSLFSPLFFVNSINVENEIINWNIIHRSQTKKQILDCILRFITNYCDLHNNYGKISAEISENLDLAKKKVEVAIKLMKLLLLTIDSQHASNYADEVELERDEDAVFCEQIIPQSQIIELRHKLAEYYDTRAWIIFRKCYFEEKIELGKLVKAYEDIRDKSIFFNPNSALYYFHMSKIAYHRYDYLYEVLKNDENKSKEDILRTKYALRLAMRHWRQATLLDKNKELYSHLRRLYEQIEENMAIWKMKSDEKN